MFDPSPTPRLFALPCGVDFGAALVEGLRARLENQPPEAMAQVDLIVNTTRMQRRVTELFDQGAASFLPRIKLLTSLAPDGLIDGEDGDPLADRLRLLHLVQGLLRSQPGLAPDMHAFDLADSVSGLLTEMAEEGVSLDRLDTIDVSDQSGHWARARAFLAIVGQFAADTQRSYARARDEVVHLCQSWSDHLPQHPIIVAGSTGSRGPAQLLMHCVARLPQGALVVPGVDTAMPEHGWRALREANPREDHPQFRILALADGLGLSPTELPCWSDVQPPAPVRNALVSLALRPAPVTHAWLTEGPLLERVAEATEGMTILEAQNQRQEALAIALKLREAAELGTSAALITPDRLLSRRVTAQLAQWDIQPDDSAGIPLHLTAPGRFLRHTSTHLAERLTAQSLLVLLKHPLCHSGAGRNEHLRLTRSLELELRANGPPFPTARDVLAFAASQEAETWGAWLIGSLFQDELVDDSFELHDILGRHVALTETLARGSVDTEGSGGLWDRFEGLAAARFIAALTQSAPAGPIVTPEDYRALFAAMIARQQQRERDAGHPGIRIWGTLEARVMDADMLILAGLNEGTWPEAPSPDPWLNRAMRRQVGLLLPERRVGLSAHDFQQAIGAKEVWLSRPIRNDGAETVPSRWLNRLTNLLGGLDAGRPALGAMKARGLAWLRLAERFESADPVEPAERPSPRPPIHSRPRKLRVTEIKTLVRDPYALYARHVLDLDPLEPLHRSPDAATRGTVLHTVFEAFIEGGDLSAPALIATASDVLSRDVPWPEARLLWTARITRIADAFVEDERQRQSISTPVRFEWPARMILKEPEFTLTAKADRIDADAAGALTLFDYKTGAPPSLKEQRAFDKQLFLMAAMAESGAFQDLPAASVRRAAYLGVGATLKTVEADLDAYPVSEVWAEFSQLITTMLSQDHGFTARRAMQRDGHKSPYDQLSRFGEWDTTQPAHPSDVS